MRGRNERERERATGRVREMNYAAKGREMGERDIPLRYMPVEVFLRVKLSAGETCDGRKGWKDEVGLAGRPRYWLKGKQERR